MKQIDIYIKEAFITKANIKQAAKSQDPQNAAELMELLFSSVNDSNAEYLENILTEAGLMPEGNIFANKNIIKDTIKWKVGTTESPSGECYTIEMNCKCKFKFSSKVTREMPTTIHICRIRKNKVLTPDGMVENYIKSKICTRPVKDILEDIFLIGEDIAEFLGIEVFDLRPTLCIK